MAILPHDPIRTRADLVRFENEATLKQRLPERSVFDVFESGAARYPERTAITMLMSGAVDEQPRRVSYGELLKLVHRAANLFARLGGKRPGVAYMLPSLIETHATLWGAETAGYAVPINFLLQPEHIASLLEASGATILVALGPHPALDIWQKALRLRERTPNLTLVRVGAPDDPREADVIDFHAALAAEPDDHLRFGDPGRDDEVAAYFHTGGTTGVPKLVAHTHRNQLVAAFGGAVLGDMRGTDLLTANLPLFHVGGTIFCALSAFLAGAGILVMSPSGMREPAMVHGFWRLIAQHRATLIGGVPTSLGAVIEVPLNGADLGAVRGGFTGAASLPFAVGESFRELTRKGLFEVYGMTECAGLMAIDPLAGEGGVGSVGWPLPYTELAVRRLEANGLGAVCDAGEIGVVTTRGPHVSPGYRNAEHDTGVFDAGVLHTGDLGYFDPEGRLHIAGRSKDLIIRSGHNIDPLMIENALAAHPAIALAAAVGQPDAYAGEVPVCYVTLREGASVSELELGDHARRTISERPAWPKQLYVVDNIPLTSVGKIYKPALRCDAAARLVRQLVCEELGLRDARVDVSDGGRRGLRVCVMLPERQREAVAGVERALSAFVFESLVHVSD